jgi:hypothetical protein
VEYGAMSLGDWCLLFLRLVVLSLGVECPLNNWTLADDTTRWALIKWHSTISQKITLPLWKPMKTFICSVMLYFVDRGPDYIPWVNVVAEHTNFHLNVMHISFKLLPPLILTIWAIMYHPYAVILLIVV